MKESFDYNEITNKLGIVPKGVSIVVPSKRNNLEPGYNCIYWELEIIEEYCDIITTPFQKLYDILHDKVDIINDICKELNFTVMLVVILHVKAGNVPLCSIPANAIKLAAALNTEIGIDLYSYESDFIESLDNTKVIKTID